jgi:hypothetical protein
MPLDVKISELPPTFAVNPADLFIVVDLSGAPTTKKIPASYLGTLAPVQSVAAKTGAVTLEITDVTDLQSALNQKQVAGNYVKLIWEAREISGTVNNYAVGSANMLVISATNSAKITGLTGGTAASWVRLINTTINTLTLAHQSLDSLPANRMIMASGVDYVLGENEEAGLFYDPVSSRWRVTTCCAAPY